MLTQGLINEYIDEICNQTGLYYSGQEREIFYKSMSDIIVSQVGNFILGFLSEDEREEYDIVAESGDNDKIAEYLYSHIENIDEKIDKEMVNIVSEIIVKMKAEIIKANVDYSQYKNEEDEEDEESIEDKLKQ